MIKELTEEQMKIYESFINSKETLKAFLEKTGIKCYSIEIIVRKKKTLDSIHNMNNIVESFIPLVTSKPSNEIVDVKNEYIKCKINGVEIEIIIKDLKELLK